MSGIVMFLFALSSPLDLSPPTVAPNDPLHVHQVSFRRASGPVELPFVSSRPRSQRFELRQAYDPRIPEAWAITTGSRSVVIELLDDGFFR